MTENQQSRPTGDESGARSAAKSPVDEQGESAVSEPSSMERIELEVPTYKRAIYEILLGMIVRLELTPGTRLTETKLAKLLNVSKTPIREALAQLAIDGLVDLEAYKGARVRWLSRSGIEEQGFLVDTLENAAYDLVVERITEEELATVDKIVEQLKLARQGGDGREFGRLTVEMHQQLFKAAGLPRLAEMITGVVGPVGLRQDWLLVYPYDETWDTLLALMEARVSAIKKRDASHAREVVRLYRVRLQEMNEARYSDPGIAEHFRD